jgi:multicomponent Na+:H+ antiporter subunit E
MAMQVLANLLIGLLWVFFQDDWSVLTFFSGYLFGLFVIFILRRFHDLLQQYPLQALDS